MNELAEVSNKQRNIWLRGVYMLLMVFAMHVSLAVLGVVALIQFAILLLGKSPNERLIAFGGSLGSYLLQIAHFLAFRTEAVPFPFSEWPTEG